MLPFNLREKYLGVVQGQQSWNIHVSKTNFHESPRPFCWSAVSLTPLKSLIPAILACSSLVRLTELFLLPGLLPCCGVGACVSQRSQELCRRELLLLAGPTMPDRFWRRDQTKHSPLPYKPWHSHFQPKVENIFVNGTPTFFIIYEDYASIEVMWWT